jgi:hypothetical protein
MCTGHATTHDNANPRLYYRPLTGGQTAVLCAGCVTALRAMGMDFIPMERRNLDTRPFVPEWLRRGKGKDLTGSAA